MEKMTYSMVLGVIFLLLPVTYLGGQQVSNTKKLLKQVYNLIPPHSKDTQYYKMESTLQKHAPDGTIQGSDVYRLYLRCVPSSNSLRGDEYTCLKFTVQIHNDSEASIPSLVNWKYYFSLTPNNEDDKGQLFGIDHTIFEKLTGDNGKRLTVESPYHVYNAFIDFHTMSVFAEKTAEGKGVQHLKQIGDKIIHAAAFSKPPVNLGSEVAKGSYFKNGEITLAFKGLGIINDKACGILGYDSGQSSFYMLLKPMPNMEVPTTGSSHYWGDIHKDLISGWIQKAVLQELVISETSVPMQKNKVNSVIERSILITNVKRTEIEK